MIYMRAYPFFVTIIITLILTLNVYAKDQRGSITYKGYTRTFLIHQPEKGRNDRPCPLVVILHGGGGEGRRMIRFTRFNDLADREGFIAVYPDGVERQWNDGRSIEQSKAHRENVDDVGFLAGLIDYMVRRYGADAKRVYLAGISNGALMSYRMACEKPHLIAAIGAIVGNLPEHLASSRPAEPVSVIIINGTDDPLVPWKGGWVRIPFLPGQVRGRVIGSVDTAAFWARANRCQSSPAAVALPDKGPGVACRVVRHAYGGCADGTDVVLYEIEGGGHTWPGRAQYMPVTIVGRACQNLDATEIIWEFFKSHGKK